MIKAKALKCRLEGMVKVKPKNNHKEDIEYRIGFIGKKHSGHSVKVVFVCGTFRHRNKAQFHKIEVSHMDTEENKNNYPGMNHIF